MRNQNTYSNITNPRKDQKIVGMGAKLLIIILIAIVIKMLVPSNIANLMNPKTALTAEQQAAEQVTKQATDAIKGLW